MLQEIDRAKHTAGEQAASLIHDGMTVGLGTGSTASHFVKALAKRCQQGLNIRCIATSRATQQLAKSLNINLLEASTVENIDVTVDGADEIDSSKNMIKGGGWSTTGRKDRCFGK